MILENLVRVKRDGGRGWHLIARETYEAAPADYELVDEAGQSWREIADEEMARLEREAAEHARAEAERIAAEEEAQRKAAVAARQASTEGAQAPQEGQSGSAPERSGAGEQGVPRGLTVADVQEISVDIAIPDAIVVAESTAGAPGSEPPSLTVAKGPGGRWFVKSGDAIVSKGFATEEEANAAMAEIAAGEQQ
jgi:hypothetical protein